MHNVQRLIAATLLSAFLAAGGELSAQSPTLDPTYGMRGIITYDRDRGPGTLQPDGTFLDVRMASRSWEGAPSDAEVVITRYDVHGLPDGTFGEKGKITVRVPDPSFSAVVAITGPDGKIVVVGGASHIAEGSGVYKRHVIDAAAIRCFPDGRLDESFGSGGIAVTESPFYKTLVRGVTVGDDGKILLVGEAFTGDLGYDSEVIVIRYTADGKPDPAFGTDGVVRTAQAGRHGAGGTAVAVQRDGKIVVAAGESLLANPGAEFVLLRYNAGGSLDRTFGDEGEVLTDIDTTRDYPTSIAIQSDGKILLAGWSSEPLNGRVRNMALLRYNSDGSPDRTFGSGGKVKGGYGIISSIGLLRDGTLAVTGTKSLDADFDTRENNRVLIARYNLRTNGTETSPPPHDPLLPTPNLRELYQTPPLPYGTPGTPDTTFGDRGIVRTNIGTAYSTGYACAVQKDGKIVAVGGANDYMPDGPHNAFFGVARYLADGTPDPAFGSGGCVKTAVGSPDRRNDRGANRSVARRVAVQEDGKIVVAGDYTNFTGDLALVRYLPDGRLDSTFGVNGKIVKKMAARFFTTSLLHIDEEGMILAGGGGDFEKRPGYALAKFRPDGSPDPTFGVDGKVMVDVFNSYLNRAAWMNAGIVQPDGKIILAGSTEFSDNGRDYSLSLCRYNPDGTLDNTFGDKGRVMTRVGRFGSSAFAIALQEDGKIVAAGSSYTEYAASEGDRMDFRLDVPDGEIVLVRYAPDGRLDPTFGTEGKVVADIGEYEERADAILVQKDGGLVVAGHMRHSRVESVSRGLLLRYNPDGTPDETFGSDGMILQRTDCTVPSGLALPANGELLVVGTELIHSPMDGGEVYTPILYLSQRHGGGGKE